MRVRLTPGTVLAFLTLSMIMHELHEHAHFLTNWLVCGKGGSRDFNWIELDSCGSSWEVLATFAGPVFTYATIWVGAFLMTSSNSNSQSLGFALVFANRPFARFITAVMRGGDELSGLRDLFPDADLNVLSVLNAILITAILIIPCVRAYKLIEKKRRILLFIGFLTVPLVVDVIVLFNIMNGMLKAGVLDQRGWLGIPFLVYIFFAVVVAVWALMRKNIDHLLVRQ